MTAKIKTAKRSNHRHKPKNVSPKAFKKVYWPYIPIVLVIGILLTLTAQTGALASLLHHPDGKVLSYATAMGIDGLLADTNSARTSNGVASLSLNDKLDQAAQAKANDMATRNYWSHNTPEGNPPWVFVTAQNYSYQKLGENLATGFDNEQSTINGWMASPPHKENLLDPAYTDVGFGFANNPDYTAAGGGPMTIVVAYYGEPQVLAAQASAPAAATQTPLPQSSPPAATSPAAQSSSNSQQSSTPSGASIKKAPSTQNNQNLQKLSGKSSRAQIALAKFPLANMATALALMCAILAIGIWLSRHALAVRRALVKSESFALRHPLMDVGLLIIAALSFLLTQTAGFIQ